MPTSVVRPQVAQAHDVRSYHFFNLHVNVQRLKHDIFITHIYYYITTNFDYMKCDSCLAEYGGVVLQWFEFTKFAREKKQ